MKTLEDLGKEFAINLWNRHIEVFQHFYLVCNNGNSLEDETKSNALFNAIVTIETMINNSQNLSEKLIHALKYLKGSKYYSDNNRNALY